MDTPKSLTEFTVVLGVLVPDDETRAMIKQFTLEEFRRGYLHGRRDMKHHVENAIAGIRVEES